MSESRLDSKQNTEKKSTETQDTETQNTEQIVGELTSRARLPFPLSLFGLQKCKAIVSGTAPVGGVEKIINGEPGVSTAFEVIAKNHKPEENDKTLLPCATEIRGKGIITKQSTSKIKFSLTKLEIVGIPTCLTHAATHFTNVDNCEMTTSSDGVLAGKCEKSAAGLHVEIGMVLEPTKGPSNSR